MRKSDRDEGMRWLEQAQVDLEWARHLYEEGAYYLVCFLAQQCTEKALKAFLYAQGEEMVIGHSVRQLAQRVREYDPHFQNEVDRWGVLDIYYIPTRYPNGLPEDIPARVYTREAGESALKVAEEAVKKITLWFQEKFS